MLARSNGTAYDPGVGVSSLGGQYLEDCRERVLDEIRAIVRARTPGNERTYQLMTDYPLRRAKALRPSLCIATCRALGGALEDVLPSAAAIEIYHNAFLIHDDIEDGSFERRGAPALHQLHGTPIALNIGDGLLALAMRPLLDNTDRLGVGRALRILEIISEMVSQSFEGQALELEWIAEGAWDLRDEDYETMVLKKTAWYSFIAPARVGAVVADADPGVERLLTAFMTSIGLAFQIQDDLLNLQANDAYGKELAGDLWEGKRTLMLLHALRSAPEEARARALEILRKPRPAGAIGSGPGPQEAGSKTEEDVQFLSRLIETHSGIFHAQSVARGHAKRAEAQWGELASGLEESVHVQFLSWLMDYVVQRGW